jgi:hypothetical protein
LITRTTRWATYGGPESSIIDSPDGATRSVALPTLPPQSMK